MPPNSAGDMYSRAQTWAAGGPSTTGPVGRGAAPGNSASKSGSEYDYGGYGSGYDYDYSNYVKQEDGNTTNYGTGLRSAYGNDSSTQPPYATSQAV
mgnify:CR=1 FL=1